MPGAIQPLRDYARTARGGSQPLAALARLPAVPAQQVAKIREGMIQFVLDTDRDLLESSFRFAQHQVRKLIETYPDFYPMYTINGRWKHEGAAWTHWCDGFLPGMMWVFVKRANHS